MNIKELAQKPKLVPLTITEEKIVEKYGEEITFYILDRQPINVYAKLATLASENKPENLEEIVKVVNSMIMDDAGNSVSTGEQGLPVDVLMSAMAVISEYLGK